MVSTPWKRSKRGYYRYFNGYLCVVDKQRVSNADESPRTVREVWRWLASVDGCPASDLGGYHKRASDAKEATDDFVRRTCTQCRRTGFMRRAADNKEITCPACLGAGRFRG